MMSLLLDKKIDLSNDIKINLMGISGLSNQSTNHSLFTKTELATLHPPLHALVVQCIQLVVS